MKPQAPRRPDTTKPSARNQSVILLTGQAVSSVGNYIYLVAINVFVLQTTHSAAAVAGLWVMAPLAAITFGTWCGSLTDRWEKRATLLGVECFRALATALIPLANHLSVLYLLLWLINGGRCFFDNAYLAYIMERIPSERRKRFNAISGMLQSGALVLGPAVGAGFLLLGAAKPAIWLDSLSFLVSAVSFLLLPRSTVSARQPQAETAASPASPASAPPPAAPQPSIPVSDAIPMPRTWRGRLLALPRTLAADWRQAGGFLRQNWLYACVYSLFWLIMSLAAAGDAQEVVFTQDALHLPSSAYSALVCAAGIGYTAGGVTAAVLARRLSTRWMMAVGAPLSLAAYLGYACSRSFPEAAACLILLGGFFSICGAGFSTYQQSALPAHLAGRVQNLLGSGQQVLNAACTVAGGLIADRIGVRLMMQSDSLIALAAALALAIVALWPAHRRTLAVGDDVAPFV
ncbi:MFS transporter [Alicyclobacillus kakegawensis]|uniref:MFS transporter n=1 Tax=Alicyclobacillus kakegawensis TaxID=392012 RepID=UPI000A50221E|nr:MFS transporter [Alicyclobacillus kakegawensis]